MKSKLDQD